MQVKSVAAATLAIFALGTGAASAQSLPYEQVEAPKTWRVDVGGGFVRGFNPAGGGAPDDVNWTWWGSASYRDVVYANGLDGLGWNAIKQDDLRAGFQLRPRFAASEIDGFEDRPELGADATAYVYKRLPGNVVVGARIQQDVSGDDAGMAWHVQAGHQRITPVGLLQVSAYGRGGDDDRLNRYVGVTQADAAGTNYQAFAGKGGISAAGATAFLAIPIGQRYGLGTFINYEAYLGDTLDSPLVQDDHIWRAGLVGVIRFSGQ